MKGKIKMFIERLMCSHEAKEIEDGDILDLRKDHRNGSYLVKKCVKCGKFYRDYNVIVN